MALLTNHRNGSVPLACLVWFGFALYLSLSPTYTPTSFLHYHSLLLYKRQQSQDFGFCWGVERSIALAYEAVEHFPDRKVHITNELIHNPEVNENLKNMKVEFIEKNPTVANPNAKNFETVGEGDVVILPAFGASFEEMSYLDQKNVEVVDTTCPWVSKVWNTVDKHQKAGHTSIIHGKYGHEETVATTSFCEDYICVKNMEEAEMVADYIVNGGDKEAFMQHFSKAVSKGFDPDTMLDKIGLANQTTMYKKETRAIGQLLQKAMMKKHGPQNVQAHYMEFDTICDATQVRRHRCCCRCCCGMNESLLRKNSIAI